MFLHVKAAFCHASLGTKVHLNIKDTTHFKGLRTVYKNAGEYLKDVGTKIIEPKVKSLMEEDDTLNLMVMLTNNFGAGVAPGKLCTPDLRKRYVVNQCGRTDNLHYMLKCAAVSIQTHLLKPLYYNLRILIHIV